MGQGKIFSWKSFKRSMFCCHVALGSCRCPPFEQQLVNIVLLLHCLWTIFQANITFYLFFSSYRWCSCWHCYLCSHCSRSRYRISLIAKVLQTVCLNNYEFLWYLIHCDSWSVCFIYYWYLLLEHIWGTYFSQTTPFEPSYVKTVAVCGL